MSDPASEYDRVAREIYRRYMPLLHDDCAPAIAAILRREFPAPSEQSENPGAPGSAPSAANRDSWYVPDLTRHWLQQNRPELMPHAEFINGQLQRAFDKGKQIGEGNAKHDIPASSAEPTKKPGAGPVSIWRTEAEQAAQQIGLHCIDQRADGGYWFHHAKAVATINHYMKQRTFISDERLKLCLTALMTVKAAISKSPKSVDFPFTIAQIIDNCLEACADDISLFTSHDCQEN